jgi:hypothetical protein
MWGWFQKSFALVFLLIVFSTMIVSLTDKQIPASFLGTKEISSPSDWIKEDQIKVYEDKVVLEINNTIWASFTNTNSMDPFLDEDSHALEIIPENENDINIGDIISYQTAYGVVIHRVIEKDVDEKGMYYLVKGDNNLFKDPFKVRFDEIKGVVVAIIY